MIITLLILMTIMLGFAIVGITIAVHERQGMTESTFRFEVEYAASACAETAIDRLGRDESYAGSETIDIDPVLGLSCTIRPIIASTTWTVEAESIFNGRVARYRVVLSSRNPVSIASWNKISSF